MIFLSNLKVLIFYFQFWHIVPMEQFLAQLEEGSELVARKIVDLLFDTYMPLDKPLEDQLFRCITLLQQNSVAARRFYRHAVKHMNITQTSM